MVTKVDIIIMKTGIRRSSGISLRKNEITRLERIKTKVVAIPMPRALIAELETARRGQSPIIKTKTGFSLRNPLVKLFNLAIPLTIHCPLPNINSKIQIPKSKSKIKNSKLQISNYGHKALHYKRPDG